MHLTWGGGLLHLFEVLPETYFNLFSRKNRQIYADVLTVLYGQYREQRFGVEYTPMRDLIEELLETRAELGMVVDVEELSIIDSDESPFRIQANAILRLLKENGWIYIETRESWIQYIVLPHYTSRILATFYELCEGRPVEYQQFAFSIYSALTGSEAQRRPSMALYDAKEKTAEFAEELSLLANNIKHHSEQLRTKDTFQGVLDHHFDEYLPAIVEKSYHRLRTSDHVSRYRQTILDTLQKWLLDEQWIARAAQDALNNEVYYLSSPEAAAEKVRQYIHEIMDTFNELDDIFTEIDKRHNKYIRASYNRLRLKTQHNSGTDTFISKILSWIGSDNSLTVIASNYNNIQSTRQITDNSFYMPRKSSIPFKPVTHIVLPINDEMKESFRNQFWEHMQGTITPEKTRDYVFSRMDGRTEMRIEELAPTNMEEFLHLAHIFLYSCQNGIGYQLIRSDKDRILHIGPYQFSDRKVKRGD